MDCSDGDITVLLADLVVDAGRSLNPAVDLGQMEGAFMQAMGYVTTEQLLTDPKTGEDCLRSNLSYIKKILLPASTTFSVLFSFT